MKKTHDLILYLLTRGILVVFLGLIGWLQLEAAGYGWLLMPSGGSNLTTESGRLVSGALVGLILLFGAAIILARTIVHLFAEFTGDFFYSTVSSEQLDHLILIPKDKRTRGLYQEAIEGYERIAAKYPQELKPYLEMLAIAAEDLQDQDRVTRIYGQGLTHLRGEEKEALVREYRKSMARFKKESVDSQPGTL